MRDSNLIKASHRTALWTLASILLLAYSAIAGGVIFGTDGVPVALSASVVAVIVLSWSLQTRGFFGENEVGILNWLEWDGGELVAVVLMSVLFALASGAHTDSIRIGTATFLAVLVLMMLMWVLARLKFGSAKAGERRRR